MFDKTYCCILRCYIVLHCQLNLRMGQTTAYVLENGVKALVMHNTVNWITRKVKFHASAAVIYCPEEFKFQVRQAGSIALYDQKSLATSV